MNNFYFLRCAHCSREYSADPGNFMYLNGAELCLCPICMKPPMDLMFKGHRGLVKVKSRACVEDVRFPPLILDKKDITVLLIQRGYKRFEIEEEQSDGAKVKHIFWAIDAWAVNDFEHRLMWVYPVHKTKFDLWSEQDIILFDREKETIRDHDIEDFDEERSELVDYLVNPSNWDVKNKGG